MALKGRGDPSDLRCFASLRGMIGAGTRVRAICGKCRTCLEVDLAPLAASLGLDSSLVDRHPPCRVTGCEGRVTFIASPREGTPFRALTRRPMPPS